MKHKYLPQIYGVVKDFHPRMIPENKVSDCNNVMFKQGRVQRRYGFAQLGPYVLNGAVTGITFYEQVRLGDRYCLVFTARDAYLYDTQTGSFTLISQTYNTGTVSANVLAVAGSGTSWSGSLVDVYSMKFGTSNKDTNSISFTGSCGWAALASETSYYGGEICYGNGVLIKTAYGSSTYVRRSTDGGSSWSSITTPISGIFSVAYGGGVWVATSSSAFAYSTDNGASFTSVTVPFGVWGSIKYGNGVFIAMSSSGPSAVIRSTDGINWSYSALSGYRSCLAYGNGRWISPVQGRRYFAVSTDDGISWSNIDVLPSGETHYCECIDYNPLSGVWCAVSSTRIMRSTDGISWTSIATPEANDWKKMAVYNGVWCVVGWDGTNRSMFSGDDGLTWTTVATISTYAWGGLCYAYGGFIATTGTAGSNNVIKMSSTINISSTVGLRVGLVLTAPFLGVGTRIKSIDWSTPSLTLDRPSIGGASSSNISADISTWYSVDSIVSGTSITLNSLGTFTGNLTNGSAVVTNIADTSVLHVGMGLSGTGIPSSASDPTYILSIDSATQITMSANASSSGTGVTITEGVAISSSHLVNYVLALSFSGDDEDFWSFAYPYSSALYDKMLVATNGVDAMVKWTGSGSLSTLTGSPPATAKYIGYFGAALYEHFIAAWTTDSGHNLAQTIEVSDAGSAESWTAGSYYDLLQTNDEIMGIEILKSRLVIYKRKSISIAWADPSGGNTDPLNLDQDVIVDIEIPCGRTAVSFGDFHLFLGADNVYKFNGIGLEPVGTEVINTMKNEWNGRYMSNAFAFAIPNENLYCIFIPTLATYNNLGVITKNEARFPDKAYVYNYEERTWTIWTFPIVGTVPLQFTCAGWVNKGYHPTVADIDVLDQTYAQMNMRWSDLIVYSKEESLLIGDSTGHIYELRDTYNTDNGTIISSSFTTRDYPMNDQKHTFMLLEAVLGMSRRLTGNIQIRASVDFGETWSDWIPVAQVGGASYVEYIANFMRKGLQVRFEVANVDGADFEIESIMIGFNDEMGKKK